MELQPVVDQIVQQGPLVAFMLWVIYSQKDTNKALLDSVKCVQDQRFAAMESHIKKLETMAEDCQRDRAILIKQNTEMQVRIQDFEQRFDKFRMVYEQKL